MSKSRNEIVRFCRDYLSVRDFQDYCENGLQVEGTERVGRIVTGVSVSARLIEEAVRRRAQMIITHHGIFKNDIPASPRITGVLRGRLKALLEHDINLCGFHLPLDAHPEIGNNVSLCRALGVGDLAAFEVGFIGDLSRPVSLDAFVAKARKVTGGPVSVYGATPAKVRRVAVISGGSSGSHEAARQRGADVFVCGDMKESFVRAVEESGLALLNAGHYNTEVMGVRNLGDLIAKKFGIPVEFVDVPCDV